MSDLVKAIQSLTRELKRYNDLHERSQPKRRPASADFYIAGSPEELEKRQLRATLEGLKEAGSAGSQRRT